MINRKKNNSEDENDENDFEIKISVKIGSKVIDEDLKTALYIPHVDKLNPVYISELLSKIPHLHARWNYLYNEAVFEYDIQKTRYEVFLAKKANEIRKELAQIEKGRITDRMVDDALKMDPEYEEYNNKLAEAKKNMKHILSLASGFGEKGEKLVNIASMMKWEAEILGGSKKLNKSTSKHIRHYENDENDKNDDHRLNGEGAKNDVWKE